MKNGQEATIMAKAPSEKEASKKIHAGYTVSMVLELLTEQEMVRVWASMKPSMIQRSALS